MSTEKSWPDCTYWWETEDREHYCGSHWNPFCEDIDSLLDELSTILSQANLFQEFGDTHPGPHDIPAEWMKGVNLRWPNADRGLIATLLITENANELVSVRPENA